MRGTRESYEKDRRIYGGINDYPSRINLRYSTVSEEFEIYSATDTNIPLCETENLGNALSNNSKSLDDFLKQFSK